MTWLGGIANDKILFYKGLGGSASRGREGRGEAGGGQGKRGRGGGASLVSYYTVSIKQGEASVDSNKPLLWLVWLH